MTPFTQGNPILLAKAMATAIAFYGMAGRGATAPGAVVIRKLGDESAPEYVVHFFNSQDGGYHGGQYTETLVQAYEAFAERIRRYDYDSALHNAFDAEAVPMIDSTEARLREALETGLDAANAVAANWSSGDLAGAVNCLEGWASDTAAEFFPNYQFTTGEEEPA
jgi:hypothetical protein